MPEGIDLKGHALSVPYQTNQSGRASKMVKLNDGRANPSQHTLNIATPLSAPFPTSDILGRSGASINSEKHATQVANFSFASLSKSCFVFRNCVL